MLVQHRIDERPTPSNVPAREVIHCSQNDCGLVYTLFYADSENGMVGSVKNTDRMWASAVELIKSSHPTHATKTYLWKAIGPGPECHWVEADTQAARAAL
jgi:hypothetical protein